MPILSERQKQVERLTRQAVRRYGSLKNRKQVSPLNQLVLGILWQVTSVRRAMRALAELERAFVDWNEVRVTHPAEVAAALSTARWALDGAERLVWLLREIHRLYDCTSLDFLRDLTSAQARSCLKSLTVVPRELADEVLLFSLGQPVLPCSTATARMCYRLGVIDDEAPTLKNQLAVAQMIDHKHYRSVHLFFCDFANRVCLADQPLCGRCPMAQHCPSRS